MRLIPPHPTSEEGKRLNPQEVDDYLLSFKIEHPHTQKLVMAGAFLVELVKHYNDAMVALSLFTSRWPLRFQHNVFFCFGDYLEKERGIKVEGFYSV